MILRGEFDFTGSIERPLGLRLFFGYFDLFFIVLAVLIAAVEPDCRLKHQKNIVSGTLDLAYSLSNPVGFGKGIVNRVSQFLHKAF